MNLSIGMFHLHSTIRAYYLLLFHIMFFLSNTFRIINLMHNCKDISILFYSFVFTYINHIVIIGHFVFVVFPSTISVANGDKY